MDRKIALKIVSKIMENIKGRSGGDDFLDCDDEVLKEMKDAWVDIILANIGTY